MVKRFTVVAVTQNVVTPFGVNQLANHALIVTGQFLLLKLLRKMAQSSYVHKKNVVIVPRLMIPFSL